MKRVNLIGMRFGRLVVLDKSTKKWKSRATRWDCVCDCGNTATVASTDLINGHTKSCGCLQKEKTANAHYTHKDSKSRLYHTYCGIKRRLTNKNSFAFKNYGGRGISISEDWKTYENFKSWSIKNGYQDGYEIHRVDKDGDYSPENCIWISREEHAKIHGKDKRKPIDMLDDNGNVVEHFEKIGLIRERHGFDIGTIRDAMKKGKKSHGFYWEFTEK